MRERSNCERLVGLSDRTLREAKITTGSRLASANKNPIHFAAERASLHFDSHREV